MTDMFESMHPSPDELQFILEFIEGAIASRDYTQALKMAQKALKTSEEQYWVDIFEGLIERITNLQNSNLVGEESQIIENKTPKINIPEIKYPKLNQKIQEESIDDLCQLSGVGPDMAQRLHNEGYHTFTQLSRTNPEELSQIRGIEVATARAIISSSRSQIISPKRSSKVQKMLDFDTPSVNLFTEMEKPPNQSKLRDVREPRIPNYDQILKAEEHCKNNIVSEPIDAINNHKLSSSDEESPNISIGQDLKSNEKENEILEEEGKEIDSEQNLNSNPYLDATIPKKTIISIFQENGYTLFPRKPSFRFYFHGIDGINLNLFSITPSKQALLIIPYKISTFSEKVMVSETEIGSINSENKTHLPHFEVSLLKNRETLLEALKSDGKLINHISEILCENISSENTAIHVEPLLIFSKVPGFREKSIIFAYQKRNQLHIIGLTQFTSFLQFVQKKIFYIEAYALSRQRKNTNRQSKEVLNKKIHRLSYPFIAYGVIFALIIASGWYDILKLCISIGYASMIFYLMGLIFLTWKNHLQKKQNFTQSFPSKSLEPLTFDEDDLTLIKEELTLEQITQFSYECFGKQNPYKIFEEVEKKQLDKINVQNSTIRKKEVQTSSKNSSNAQISVVSKENELVKKYSSFLDD